jgi:hypothetical protein
VELATQAAGAHVGGEIALGGGDETHVEVDLEDAQELGLQTRGELSDLVEEEGSAHRIEELSLEVATERLHAGFALSPTQVWIGGEKGTLLVLNP